MQTSGFNYNQYVFDWQKYLNTFDFYTKNNNGTLEISQKNYCVNCYIGKSEESVNQKYYQNSFSIPKGYSIRFELIKNGSPYIKNSSESIIWEAINRGQQATDAKEENHNFEGLFVNKNYCNAGAGYLGHHYLKCTIRRQFSDNIVLKFPIFVQ